MAGTNSSLKRGAAREIISLPVSEVRPYEKNPRKNAEAVKYVKASIEKFGFKVPIVIDSNRVVVCGHTRLMAAKSLGMDEVPCIMASDLTDEQIKAFRLADNKVGEFAEWDDSLLGAELSDIASMGDIDMGDFGFDLSEMEEETKAEVTEDEIPEKVEPVCKRGDIWQLGEHRLMCGDSTDAEQVAKLMDGHIVDMAFTSPPYNAGASEELSGNTHTKGSKYANSDDNLVDYKGLLFKSTKNGIDFSKYSFVNLQMLAGNKTDVCEYFAAFRDNLCDIGIWNKTSTAPAMAKRVMNSQFEFIFIFSKDKPSRAVGTREFRGTVSNVFTCQPMRNNEFSYIHAAKFSVEFASYYITTFSNHGESILDLFGGTGTTLVTCEQLGRKCYMMELDPQYCDVIIARWEKLTGQKAEKLGGADGEGG
jgi:site-specific DNA-methyltransferase (adenine-specific)